MRIVKRIAILGGCQCMNTKEKIRMRKNERWGKALRYNG